MNSLHFGSAMIDIITLIAPEHIERATFANEGASFLMLETGRKVPAEAITSHVGGGACNTAVGLARRGWHAAVRAKVGDDLNAGAVRAHIAQEGVADRMVVSGSATGTAVMVASHDRNASIFVHRGANEDLSVGDVPDMDGLDLVYVAPLSSGSALVMPLIAERGSAAGAFVAVNPGLRHLQSRGAEIVGALRHIDLLSINRVEAEALMPVLGTLAGPRAPVDGTAVGGADQPAAAPDDPPALLARGLINGGFTMGLIAFLDALRDRGTGWVSITDGTEGAYLAGPDGVFWHPALPVRVAGTAGAGDAFCSTLAAALAEGADAEDAMRWASCNAASVVGHVDTTTGLLAPDALSAFAGRFTDAAIRRIA